MCQVRINVVLYTAVSSAVCTAAVVLPITTIDTTAAVLLLAVTIVTIDTVFFTAVKRSRYGWYMVIMVTMICVCWMIT